MNDVIIKQLAKELKLNEKQVLSVLTLLQDGSTVPFIARYRKEATGNLDEDVIRLIEKEYKYQVNLEKRKEEVIRLIDEKKMLTDELKAEIISATKLQQVEDLYLPFKEKRKTKATEAIKKGLEPLADFIATFPKTEKDILGKASEFINDEVKTIEEAIEGAGYILAERISDTAKFREFTRKNVYQSALLVSKVKRKGQENDPKGKYEMYYDFSQPVNKLPSYRVLAFNRGEKEKVLNVKLEYVADRSLDFIAKTVVKDESAYAAKLYEDIIKDAFERLIFPSIEREIRALITEKAEEKAIELFAENLDALVMQPPVKNKTILSVDPAYRTGCKMAVVDQTGALKKIDVIYPHEPRNDHKGSIKKLDAIINEFKIDLIVGGNGTASRETEKFINDYIASKNLDVKYKIVSEAGASVYSASKIAQDEFPDLAVEERSAVSIARRVQDPMAELVKIDPKAIGVGQYQHDVNQKNLGENLEFEMIKNINKVGIDVNTASAQLLKYVSGLDKTIASNIVAYRNENGKFTKRSQLKDVKRLGAKAFEQCAGFLKILDGDEKLDATFIHPESYKVANQIIKEIGLDKDALGSEETIAICNQVNIADLAKQIDQSDILVSDIIAAFISPNIDIRDDIEVAEFDQSLTDITDLKEGMKVQGQVRNIVDFGAFVDIGLKQDALVHVSQISNSFVHQVSDFLKIGQVLEFTVLDFDVEKGRVQLTLKEK